MKDLQVETETHIKDIGSGVPLDDSTTKNDYSIDTETNNYQKVEIETSPQSKRTVSQDEIMDTTTFSKELKDVKRPLKSRINIFLRKHFLNKKDLIFFCLNVIVMLMYYISLAPCSNIRTCNGGLGLKFFTLAGVLVIISTLYMALIAFMCIYTKKHFFHYCYIIPVFCYLFIAFTGTNNTNHGTYNKLAFILFFIIFFTLFGIISFIVSLIKKKRYVIVGSIIISILLLVIFYNTNVLLDFSCDRWDKGINNTRIIEDDRDYACTIVQPGKNKCYMYAMEGWFNFSKWINQRCDSDKERQNERQLFDEMSLPEFQNKNHFGYPITNREKFNPKKHTSLQKFQAFVLKNMIDMEEYEKGNYPDEPRPEVEVRFDPKTNHGNISIHLNKNETLAQERKEIAKNSTSLYQNILMIYTDAVSRQNFYRKLKKTADFLEPFTRYDPNQETKDFSVFQFMKYHTLRAQTVSNIKPMFYGAGFTETHGTNLVKWMKEQGFVTGHSQSSCGREIFSIQIDEDAEIFKDLEYDSWDHENIAMFCDNNFYSPDFAINKGVSSMFQRCLYGTNTHNHAIEYAIQFWEAYKDNKKFFRLHVNDAHEGTNTVIGYYNDALYNFVKTMYDKGYFENTFVMFVSDHGHQVPGPWTLIHSKDLLIERTLGTLFFMIPNEKRLYENGWYDNLIKNQQTFVTPYDIYDTMLYLGTGNNPKYKDIISHRGQSLLSYVDETQRYCENPSLELGIHKDDCQCRAKKSLLTKKNIN